MLGLLFGKAVIFIFLSYRGSLLSSVLIEVLQSFNYNILSTVWSSLFIQGGLRILEASRSQRIILMWNPSFSGARISTELRSTTPLFCFETFTLSGTEPSPSQFSIQVVYIALHCGVVTNTCELVRLIAKIYRQRITPLPRHSQYRSSQMKLSCNLTCSFPVAKLSLHVSQVILA